VVLLPLAIVGTIAIAVRPTWRGRYGPLVVAIAAAATVLVPVSTSSGEALEERVGRPGEHAELGDQLIWFALPLLLLAVALVVLDHRARRVGAETPREGAEAPDRSRAMTIVAVFAVVAALACGVQVFRVGDSGARAAWGERVAAK
jgi:hypothetical protein